VNKDLANMQRRFALFALALACAACGSGGLYPVSGTVKYQGEPAAGATVTFLPKGQTDKSSAAVAQGVVGEDGTFKLAGPAGEGLKPGEYVVLVEWKEGGGRGKGRAPALNAPDRLKKRYLDPNRPLLTATVEAKTNKLPVFDLQ
jgi:hypothetical protein